MADLPAWGIHLGAASVRGVKLQKDGDVVRVVAHEQIDFADDIEDITSLERFSAQAHGLAVFLKRHDTSRSRVWVSVDAATSFNRYVETPPLRDDSLARIIELEAAQQIPWALDKVFWDFKELEVDREDDGVECILFALKKDVIDDRMRKLARVRCPVDGMQLAPVALYNFLVHEKLARDGHVFVAVDYDRTDIVVCHGPRFWFRTLPIGAHVVSDEARRRVDVKHRALLRTMRGEADAADEEEIKLARRAAAKILAPEIDRMIRYYRGAHADFDLQSIMLLPGTAYSPPLARRLEKLTGVSVYGLKSFRHLEISPSIVTPEIEGNIAPLAHAAGLALQAHDVADVETRLFPETFERVIAGRRIFHVLAVLAVLLGVAGLWWMTRSQAEQVGEAQRLLNAAIGDAEARSEAFKNKREEVEIRDAMMPFLESGAARRTPVSALGAFLSALKRANEGRDEDESLYFVDARTTQIDGAPASRSIAAVVGTAETGKPEVVADRLKRRLEQAFKREPRFRDLELVRWFVGPRLASTGAADVGKRRLRRRFVMGQIKFRFDEPSTEGPEQ